jgi:hypothetical protein
MVFDLKSSGIKETGIDFRSIAGPEKGTMRVSDCSFELGLKGGEI